MTTIPKQTEIELIPNPHANFEIAYAGVLWLNDALGKKPVIYRLKIKSHCKKISKQIARDLYPGYLEPTGRNPYTRLRRLCENTVWPLVDARTSARSRHKKLRLVQPRPHEAGTQVSLRLARPRSGGGGGGCTG
jgi:hypothetical protein